MTVPFDEGKQPMRQLAAISAKVELLVK